MLVSRYQGDINRFMKYRINNIKVPIEDRNVDIRDFIVNKLRIKKEEIVSCKIVKESIDARKKDIKYVYSILIDTGKRKLFENSDVIQIKEKKPEKICYGNKKLLQRPVIVGFGPAGMFNDYIM